MNWLSPQEYVKTLPKHTMYASLYVRDTRGRILHLHANYDTPEVWQWPGGKAEEGETPWHTALREAQEETGHTFVVFPLLLAVLHHSPHQDWPNAHMGFIFDGGTLTDDEINALHLDPEEHTEFRLRTLPEWEATLDTWTYKKLVAVDESLRSGHVAYIET